MKNVTIGIIILGISSCFGYDYISFGPNINFKKGLKIYSFGFEISYWKNNENLPEPNYGIDIGFEWFRKVKSLQTSKRRIKPEENFKRNMRIYSEFQVGQIFYGISSGPFLEIRKSVFGTTFNYGIQSTIWTNLILGLDVRPTLSLNGFDYSYGGYLRLGSLGESP